MIRDELEKVAMRAAHAAGRIHLKGLNRAKVSRKSSAIDLVTTVDRSAEAAVIEIIQRAFPTHAILAEEGGASEHESEHRWIIDPLDGTTNFVHSFPAFCVSIAHAHRGRTDFAVVFDALRKECFTAWRGRGAFLNGAPIRVSRVTTLAEALLATGFAYDRRERRRFYLCFWEEFMTRVQGVRRTGSAALDLCYVASGRTDGFWEFSLKPWDVAAGSLIVSEAGGRATNMDGSTLDLAGGNILATNGRIHDEMIEVIRGTRPEAERRHTELARIEGRAA
ncbi:MAG TPA: inositol monophosphatase family protein [Candidatus Binataceae bacterium]|nr:inositol monophosphatase family protein [Candidatus Binataceae bacterium]